MADGKATKEQIKRIYALGAAAGLLDSSRGTDDELHLWVRSFTFVEHISDLTEKQAAFVIARLKDYCNAVKDSRPVETGMTEEQKLGAAIAEHEKNNNVPTSAVQQLVEAFLSIGNPAKRAKKIAEIKSRATELNTMLCENSDLLTAEVEQALLRAATGYTVTEHKVKLVNGMKTVEKIEKHIQPSQAAIEFYLTNKKPEAYSRAGGSRNGSEDKISEILEALKNA